jgi:hypothetical protein
MTQEDKTEIAKAIRQETGCGMMTALNGLNQLLTALKQQPKLIMDNPPRLKFIWEYDK